MNHQPLSAGFVLGWASLNSAELSRSGRPAISIQLAWLTGLAGARGPVHRGMGETTGYAVLWPGPPAAPYRAGLPSHSSQPGSGKSSVVSAMVAEKDSCSQTHSSASEQTVLFRRGKLYPVH